MRSTLGLEPWPILIAVMRGERVVLPDGVRPATIHIRDGRIAAIARLPPHRRGRVASIDAGELVVMPGLVDTHVHINDPGRTDWEGFEHATRAAAAGGVTTLVDMPLNSIPADDDRRRARGQAPRRGGAVSCRRRVLGRRRPGNAGDARAAGARAACSASSVSCRRRASTEFDHVSEADLREALPILAAAGLPLLVHAELPALLREPDPGAIRAHYGPGSTAGRPTPSTPRSSC